MLVDMARLVPLLLLLLLAHTALPAVVLPRPPSSPNYIPVDYAAVVPAPAIDSSKSYGNKVLYQRTNVEKPETPQDFRFLEIEVRNAENVDPLELHGLVQAVLEKHQLQQLQEEQQQQQPNARRLDDDADDVDELESDIPDGSSNVTYSRPEIVPQSIVGVREVGLRPNQRFYEPGTLDNPNENEHHYLLSSLQSSKNLGDEKLYYLKNGRPKVYVNFRGRSGNFRQDTATGADSRFTLRLEPSTILRATQPYHVDKKIKSPKLPPKKYDSRIHGSSGSEVRRSSATTENAMVTSSELPKQIPAPPSKVPIPSSTVHTTPVLRYIARRTDILPGYAFAEP